MNENKTAAVVIIGDEILSGRTKDSNAGFIAERLSLRGLHLKVIITIPDDLEKIIDTVNLYRKTYDFVFTCGGIGATPDDLTREALAKAFGKRCQRNIEAAKQLENYYKERINDLRLRMADLPEDCVLIPNATSGAPGFRLENVYVFPGVPKLMREMFLSIEKELPQGKIFKTEVKSPIGETLFADLMEEALKKFPDVKIGSYPELDEASGSWQCKLTFTAGSEKAVLEAQTFLMSAIEKRASGN